MDFWDLNPHALRNDASPRTRAMVRLGMVGCVLDRISAHDWRAVRNWCESNPGTVLSRRVAESADGLASWSAYIWFPEQDTKSLFMAFACALPGRPYSVDLGPSDDEGARKAARKAARTAERKGQNVWLRERWDGTYVVEFADMQQALDFTVRWGGRISAEGGEDYLSPVPSVPHAAMEHSQAERFLSFRMRPHLDLRSAFAA